MIQRFYSKIYLYSRVIFQHLCTALCMSSVVRTDAALTTYSDAMGRTIVLMALMRLVVMVRPF